jgi:hypothetical protein
LNGRIKSEPIQVIEKDGPATCVYYKKRKAYLMHLVVSNSISQQQTKFTFVVNQAKMRSFKNVPRDKNGFEVPKTYEQALRLEGKTQVAGCHSLEIQQISE